MNQTAVDRGRLQIRFPQGRNGRVARLARLIGREPFRARPWAEVGFFLASSVLSLAAAVVLGVLAITGAALTVVFVGTVVLAGGMRVARGLGGWQRALARNVLGEQIGEPDPFTARPGLTGWLRAALGDRAAWRALGYFAFKVPFTVFGVWFALSIWIEALSGIASPLTGATGTVRFGAGIRVHGPGLAGAPAAGLAGRLGLFAVGLVLFFAAPWAMRLVVQIDRRIMHLLLGPDAATTRVRSLEESRSRSLDAATETLRRIERNLHDGTQAQLVALAMRLGQAKEKLDMLPAEARTGDIESVRRLVEDAHRGAKEAITDLRDLARGIHPPALDTGLENALTTLAARSPVPTEVTVSLRTRPSPAVEAISYFCAAELLANVAQHARATRASLTCAQHGGWLRIVVRDDGSGGAAVSHDGSSSSGLAGLADRVGAVDGHLSIASPRGGPTAVTVDLPVRS